MSAAICVTLKPEATIYTITANGQELQGFTLESQWEGFKKLRRGDSVVILVEKKPQSFVLRLGAPWCDALGVAADDEEYVAIMASPDLLGVVIPKSDTKPVDHHPTAEMQLAGSAVEIDTPGHHNTVGWLTAARVWIAMADVQANARSKEQ